MNLTKLTLTCTAAMLLAGTAAQADNIDFSCSLSPTEHCTGSITPSGSNYSTSGISAFNDSGPYSVTVPFELILNTATGTVSLDGTGVYAGQDLVGTITGFSVSKGKTSTDLQFTANWPTLPPLVRAQLGTSTGIDSGFVIALNKNGRAQSVDVLITPTPEPGSLALLGSGLVAIGGFLRRKRRVKPESGSLASALSRRQVPK